MKTTVYWWFLLTAVAVAVLFPLPYLLDSLGELAKDSPLAANYASQGVVVRTAFYAHIVFGGLALLLSPVQFAARIRNRAPRVHRVVGRIALASILVGGVSGVVIAPVNMAGPIGTAGFGTLGVLWVAFAVMTFAAIRKGEVERHRRWATRTFALTYAGVALRLWLLVLMPALGSFEAAYATVPFLCWVPNLVVAEWVIRRSRRSRGTAGVAARPLR
ncbi:DUF2306 domain-containing protein [Herbidospora cretacea]|uniref:DUF2306 domain-containing protein n=1 Tax=Herbidospora cretacea TaxID=28444 RepID=UPI0007740A70|nr:DUF2306 domain-containing protein [Herbidospora cretacea]